MTLIFLIIGSVIIIPAIIGGITLLLFRNNHHHIKKTQNTPALLFHSVTDKSFIDQSHITTDKLTDFLSYLQNQNYKTLTAYESTLLSEEQIDSSTSYVALIFDDGFENFYTKAFPILEQNTMKASIFIVVNCIDLYSSWDVYKPNKQLSKGQIRLISDAGHEIGSHTLTHPDLVLLPDKEIKHELSESKKRLEDITGKPVTSLSFPFGSWNMRVWNLAREYGYDAAVAYRDHAKIIHPIIPVTGVYAFDTVEDILEKIEKRHPFSPVHAVSAVMPHFAKGTPVWKFRKMYNIFNSFR